MTQQSFYFLIAFGVMALFYLFVIWYLQRTNKAEKKRKAKQERKKYFEENWNT